MYDILALAARYIFIFVSILIVLSIIGIQKAQDAQRKKNEAIHNNQNNGENHVKIYIKNIDEPRSRVWEVELEQDTTIGRGNDNGIVLQDASISKNHAVIYKKSSQYFIQDLNSTNGTYHNGKKIKKAVKLDDSSVVLIGPFEITLTQLINK